MAKINIIFVSMLLVMVFACNEGRCQETQLNWLGHWKGEDKREQLVKEVKKEFEFLHPDITVNLLYNKDLTGPGKNYKWKTAYEIVEMIQTGNIKWDVIPLGGAVYNHVAELLGDKKWGAKHLVDFSEIPGFLKTQKDFITKDPYYTDQTGGVFVGPLIEGFITCLWYNPEVAAKIEIKVRQRGMSIDDLVNYARHLSEFNRKNNTGIPFIKLGSWNRLEILFEHLYKTQFADPLKAIEEKFSKNKLVEFENTLLLFEQLAQYQPVLNKNWEGLSWEQWKKDFLDGDGLFIVAGTYMYSLFRGVDPEKFKKVIPVELPSVIKQNGLVGDYINTFAVMKNSKNVQAGIDLLMLWSEPKIAEKWVLYTRNPTGIKGNMNEPVSEALPGGVYTRFVKDMNKKYAHLPMRYFRAPTYVFGPENPVSANELRSKLAEILQGKLSAAKYSDDVTRRLNKGKERKP